MFIVIKTVSWVEAGRPMVGAGVEETFVSGNQARVYIGRKLEELEKDGGYDHVDGQYPQIVAQNKRTKDWIQYYVQERKVTV